MILPTRATLPLLPVLLATLVGLSGCSDLGGPRGNDDDTSSDDDDSAPDDDDDPGCEGTTHAPYERLRVDVTELRLEIIDIFGAPGTAGAEVDDNAADDDVPAIVITTQTHIPYEAGMNTDWTASRSGTYIWRIVGVTAEGAYSAATSTEMYVEPGASIQFTIANDAAHAYYRLYRSDRNGTEGTSTFVAEISNGAGDTVITDDYFPTEIYEYFNSPGYTTSYWVFDWLPGGLDRWEQQYAELNPASPTLGMPTTQYSSLADVGTLIQIVNIYLDPERALISSGSRLDLLLLQMSELGIDVYKVETS